MQLQGRVKALEARASVSEDVDAELQKFLHDLTDEEVARLAACIAPGGKGRLCVSGAEFDRVATEVIEARDARQAELARGRGVP